MCDTTVGKPPNLDVDNLLVAYNDVATNAWAIDALEVNYHDVQEHTELKHSFLGMCPISMPIPITDVLKDVELGSNTTN